MGTVYRSKYKMRAVGKLDWEGEGGDSKAGKLDVMKNERSRGGRGGGQNLINTQHTPTNYMSFGLMYTLLTTRPILCRPNYLHANISSTDE
jgi:hypothetical protein